MGTDTAISRLSLKAILDRVGDIDPASVYVRVRDFSTDGIYDAGTVELDETGDILVGP